IAYNFDVPIIATDVGGLAEVVKEGISGLIASEATPETIAKKVIQYFQKNLEYTLTDGVLDEKQKYSWDAFAEGIERLLLS
ncbi:MAG TPA: glycosyltransferase, partial [Candidatus Kapabacteria bacterium]|nr:glycosyltransferase [Candidatus Kapabacteria bacterium]